MSIFKLFKTRAIDIRTSKPKDDKASWISLLCSKQYPPKFLVTIFSMISSISNEIGLFNSTAILLKLNVARCFFCISFTKSSVSFFGFTFIFLK